MKIPSAKKSTTFGSPVEVYRICLIYSSTLNMTAVRSSGNVGGLVTQCVALCLDSHCCENPSSNLNNPAVIQTG
jgi:hypothetical protein